jgi:RsiW-degrading membrane proteinase PrsW (M82 family)
MELLSSLFSLSGEYFISFFQNANLIGIFLAILFGAFWLFFYKPPFLKHDWLWAILIAGALVTLLASTFIQIPLQVAVGKLFYANWTEAQLMKGILFTSLPTIFIGCLVQEGAKLVPVVVYWWRKSKKIDPKFGLVIGAIAGAGFGIFETQSMYNSLFAMGWTWNAVETTGFNALLPFIERFFFIGFNIAMTALAGYGLAKGMGWQFYLIVSGIHNVVNYLTVLMQIKLLSIEAVETFIVLIAIGAVIVTLWLLKRKEPALKEDTK